MTGQKGISSPVSLLTVLLTGLFSHLSGRPKKRAPEKKKNKKESEQFRFLRAACYANIKGSVGLILAKASAMRISIPLDLSSRSFIPPSRFMRSRRAATLLAPSLVFTPRRFA